MRFIQICSTFDVFCAIHVRTKQKSLPHGLFSFSIFKGVIITCISILFNCLFLVVVILGFLSDMPFLKSGFHI